MRKALLDLKRFIAAKNNEDECTEIRAYALENAEEIGAALGVTASKFATAINAVDVDDVLGTRILGTIKAAEASCRAERVEARALAAQQTADLLGSAAKWQGNAASVDVASLLASGLTRRTDMLVFTCDAFTVAVYMASLFDLAKLGRVDLAAFVDAYGLHIRWSGEKGGVNLRPQTDPHAAKIVVNLAPRESVDGAVAA